MKNMLKYTTYGEFKIKALSNNKVKNAFDKLESEYQIACQIIEGRIKNKMTQEDLAKKVGTGQAVISRLEGMNAKPSISLLERVAHALNTKINITVG
jgi:ribosome-binding protein aMBF1 (putative translation factor)